MKSSWESNRTTLSKSLMLAKWSRHREDKVKIRRPVNKGLQTVMDFHSLSLSKPINALRRASRKAHNKMGLEASVSGEVSIV